MEATEYEQLRALLEQMRRDMSESERRHALEVVRMTGEIHALRAEVADLRSERDAERFLMFGAASSLATRASSLAESVGGGKPWRQVLKEADLLRASVVRVIDDMQTFADREDRARLSAGVPADIDTSDIP